MQELNGNLCSEDYLLTQGMGMNACRKCHSGGGHFMCSHCKDFICVNCRKFCWKCIHKKEFNFKKESPLKPLS